MLFAEDLLGPLGHLLAAILLRPRDAGPTRFIELTLPGNDSIKRLTLS
jgi:hypothetical protein